MNTPPNAGALLDERDVSALLKVAIPTLRNWRSKGIGPVFLKVGKRCVRYRQCDVAAFLAQGTREPERAP